ncbi:beta-ketoacyl synthase chain length factor [Methylogaea oryzae]|uniref:3-oxoacyl-ACP synthase n=1 Tax=Methylogaea oryzae TaxID=1295382 RepID=A0A8D4VRD4_9GAMM|nr:beta-ketoacyl synthase chain length factor [Methylogaea oryzae]BBL71852.1 3-oxoacyl-ACP synthase [Methylogaea oryzae]
MGRETQLCFTLEHWCLWRSEATPSAGCWPAGEVLPCNGGAADVGFLPMMQRRRLSPLGRAASAVAWRCRQVGGDMPSVFFSRHGESQYYFEMLEGLAAGEEVSPSRFSLSVHNAIAGLCSFHGDSFQPYVSLAGGTEGLFAAFLEAAGLLLESPRTLVVCYEQPLPGAYRDYAASPRITWALGMVLAGGGTGPKLRLARVGGAVGDADADEPGLVQAIRQGRRSGCSRPGSSVWRWSLDDA